MGETRTSALVDTSLAPGTYNFEIGTAERETIVVFWKMTNATAVGDLGTAEVRLVDPGGDVVPTALMPTILSPATLDGTVVSEVHRYDVRGATKVQVRVANAAAGARDTKIFVTHYWG